jgi:4-diphosphocytidyl-2-C-methyl-D-erythritol kinase
VAIRHRAVRVFAPAKINLCLHVTGKRADGFHDLQSLVAFADVGDRLTLEPAVEFSLALEGSFAAELRGEKDNLVLRAARLLAAKVEGHEGARIILKKELPVASGIGGGSADAAAALRGLMHLWGREEDGIDLGTLGASLGSDVPVCVPSQAAWMEGRGEIVTALPALPAVSLVLVNPGVSVSTADIFRRLSIRERQRLERPEPFASGGDLVCYLRATQNDLEEPALTAAPIIGSVIERLSHAGASLARMSGSGATCFGLFETDGQAKAVAEKLRSDEPAWWVRSGRFIDAAFARPGVDV